MGWLDYSSDEVTVFHPAFHGAADEALRISGLATQFRWEHHPARTPRSIFPDFALVRKSTGHWVLCVEIKRRRESVYSTRYQYQAKSYAEENDHRYPPGAPRFFALTNLETTVLFAINGTRPPLECQVEDGVKSSGDFKRDAAAQHRSRFARDLADLLNRVVAGGPPRFETVWPSVLDDLFSQAGQVPALREIEVKAPRTPNWPTVAAYFSRPTDEEAARLFLLRCLVAEYLRGALARYGHPQAATVPPLRPEPKRRVPAGVANTIEKLMAVDFSGFFEEGAPDIYRSLHDPRLRDILQSYVQRLVTTHHVGRLAELRVDPLELLDSLFSRAYPIESLEPEGKVQTDPELAELLAALTIAGAPDLVLDPCCGQGPLLSAAYDRLTELGVATDRALEMLCGTEADTLSARIAALRLALRNPLVLRPNLKIHVVVGDMFQQTGILSRAGSILMNPPFKRYEAQDDHPERRETLKRLREHYASAVKALDGRPAQTTKGQANLYNFYVEFVVKAAKPGARLGIILDNKWYHSGYEVPLRKFLLDNCKIHAIVEYPHYLYFRGFTIATSILVAEKAARVPSGHEVRFVRCRVDPLESDTAVLASAIQGKSPWPAGWHENRVPQRDLDPRDGWKVHFQVPFANDFTKPLTGLGELFEFCRRGSLNKEEGGVGAIDFPFNRTNYGPKRAPYAGAGRRRAWQTRTVRKLTADENESLSRSADRIPDRFRGWALRNANDIDGYELRESDVTKVETLEPPLLRRKDIFFEARRTDWTRGHERALREMKRHPNVKPFIDKLRHLVGLGERTLPREDLWVCLREPYVGELIIPRKLRAGHRVHLNPFAFNPRGRQVRVSSNFIAYGNCLATDEKRGLDRAAAASLIAAFLVSAFGQVQFEREGYNREGVLSVEKEHLNRVKVLDPRQILPEERDAILEAFKRLPYPIATDRFSNAQTERNVLDGAVAGVISRLTGLDRVSLLEEVHQILDEWLEARMP